MNLEPTELPHTVVGALMEVYKELGPGLLIEAYTVALERELAMRELMFERNVPLKLLYKGHEMPIGAHLDFVVEGSIIIDLHAKVDLSSIHKEILGNFLKISGIETGLLVNFHVDEFRKGLKRLIVSPDEPMVPFRETRKVENF